jgi:uncharacterized protein
MNTVANIKSDALIRDLVDRIVKVAQPQRILLFGSAARGDAGPDSDLDVLVIKAGVRRRALAASIYRGLIGLGRAVDVVVVTPDDIREYGNNPSLVLYPAINEGIEIYAT